MRNIQPDTSMREGIGGGGGSSGTSTTIPKK